MRTSLKILPAAIALVAIVGSQGPGSIGLGSLAFAQGVPQTAGIVKVDPATVTTGFRASKVIGATVVNDNGQNVGTIDDLIVTPNEQVPFAVLSVGGFLGMGTKYIVISYSSLLIRNNQMVLHGATKESLKALPEFKYFITRGYLTNVSSS